MFQKATEIDFKNKKIPKDWILNFIVVISFLILIGVYLFNATNNSAEDIPTDLITGIIGTIVGFYFLRRKND